MNVRLHIERLVLDGAHAGMDRKELGRAVEHELARLLTGSPLAPGLTRGGGVPTVRGGEILEPATDASAFGTQIAAAMHEGLSGEGRSGGAP
jgi:hypothetical protein